MAWATVALLSPAFAAQPLPEPRLQLSHDAATARWKGVGEKPSADPQAEWLRLVNRDTEARQIDELLQRVGSIEKLTVETRRAVEAIPAAGPRPSAPHPPPAPAEDAEPPWLAYGGGAALVLLIVAGWRLARRRRELSEEEVPAPSPAPQAASGRFVPAPATPSPPSPPPPPPPSPPMVKPAPVAPAAPVAQTPSEPAPVAMSPAPMAVPPPAAPTATAPAISSPAPAEPGRPAGSSPTDQSLELAEIMLSMGLANGAAQTLVERIHANPREALLHWLKLLDIYRSSGHRHEFKEAAEELRQHFNIKAEDWNSAGNGKRPSLEDYPRVLTHLEETWKDPAATIDYLRHLLEDNREGTREGFPQPVAEEIVLLLAIQREQVD